MYSKPSGKWLKHLDFLIFDLIILTGAYIFSCLLRYDFKVPSVWVPLFTRSGVALLVLYITVAAVSRNYHDILQRNRWAEAGRVFTQILFTFVLFILYLYIIKENDFSRRIYAYSAGMSLIAIWCWRVIWKRIIRNRLVKDNNLPQLLIISDRYAAADIAYRIKKKQYDYFRIKGIVTFGNDENEKDSPDKSGGFFNDDELIINRGVEPGRAGSGSTFVIPVVCKSEDIKAYLLSGVVDEVFIRVDDDKTEKEITDYCLELGITVHIALSEVNMRHTNMFIGKVGGNTVLTASNNVTAEWKLALKRAFDILGGLAGCVVMLIMYLYVAPKIRRADPGPVFFKQERIGKNGRHFMIYKFRSMYLDAEARKAELMEKNEMKGHMFKMENDPRILPGIGARIRKSSIDEWPQFINVLKGDMSLVGTRPPTVDEYTHYEPHHKARLSFRPGITGLWQVSGRSEITDFEEIVRLDNRYIREWSLGLDAGILVKTVYVVASHKGAE
ncbi:MAG: sugar transferase [Parasporobacterium sp.]|nr:sugar transferase [Parasporobacterium sp.]